MAAFLFLVGEIGVRGKNVMNKHPERIDHLVIVGGGTAGWMTAASMAAYLIKSPTRITVIESSDIGTVGVGEATIPSIRRFYSRLGMSDHEVIQKTKATCKLAIQFVDWHTKGSSFFHPFGLFGQDVKNIHFLHFWMKLKNLGEVSDLSEYSLGIALAQYNKFTTPSPNPPSTLSIFDWALHFDAGLFAQLMRQYAEGHGVQRIDAKITKVNLREEDGFIESVTPESGESISGDLFIDCSGFRGLLIEEALHTGYEDWSQWMPCDSAVAVASEAGSDMPPYTRAQAHASGWQWRIPLQHRYGNGHVYSSRYMSEDEAVNLLRKHIHEPIIGEPRKFKFLPGRRKKAWNKNCIAIGLSAGFIEPLESTSIALIETGIDKIKLLFPDKQMQQACVDEFNSMTKLEYERVRDFIILHYKATGRDDSPMWRHCQTMAVPKTLQNKMDLFRARGHFVKYRWEIFQPASWLALYNGFKIFPQTYDMGVDNFDTAYLESSLTQMRTSVYEAAQAAPLHADFISKNFTQKIV